MSDKIVWWLARLIANNEFLFVNFMRIFWPMLTRHEQLHIAMKHTIFIPMVKPRNDDL